MSSWSTSLGAFAIVLLASGAFAGTIRINEFLADNTSTSLEDEDGDTPDWVELYNPKSSPFELAGRFLTDDPSELAKWEFPAVSVPGHGYLMIFASGKNRTPANGDPLHTNFLLDRSGEYLALVDADGTTVLSEFGSNGAEFPEQRPGWSYGDIGSPGQVGYMPNPTPGSANDGNGTVLGFVADTEFDINRGFFNTPISVRITSSTPGAVIRFTTDGSWPSETTGTVYTQPVFINRTTPLKAIASKSGYASSNVDTQTYIFVDEVVTQTHQNTQSARGFPADWDGFPAYYGMDGNLSRVDPLADPTIRDELVRIPSLSIAMDLDDLFGTEGIYAHPLQDGLRWERKTSLEFIDPDPPDGTGDFQQNCAIRIQGGAFRHLSNTRKKSFRVLFKSDYGLSNQPTGGPGKLDFPLFGPDAADEFQTLIFRAEANDGWSWKGARNQPQYARDEFGRQLHRELGHPASHGRYCHLYLNGAYWGVYNVVERPDSGFAESYLGVDRESWQGQNAGQPINENLSLQDWSEFLDVLDNISAQAGDAARNRSYLRVCGFTLGGSRHEPFEVWFDPDNFIDYLLANWFGANEDWPRHNYYCGRDPGPNSSGYKFFMWDVEASLGLATHITFDQTGNFDGVGAPQEHLEQSPEYRVRFGDRAHAALFNGGALTRGRTAGLYRRITALHSRILIPESARWGNQHGDRRHVGEWHTEWRRLVDSGDGWFARRPAILLNELKGRGLYPDLEAPTYSQHGGSLVAGAGPTLSVPDHVTKVYYCHGPRDVDLTDYGHSLDPRLVGGGINPDATLIDFGAPGDGAGTHTSAPLALTQPGFLLSRSYDSATGEWSALNSALFTINTVPATSANLVISEIHYHPAAPSAEEIAAGFADQNLFEFLEVQNIGESNADLTGVEFISGVAFTFPPGFTLAPGARAVAVKDPGAFSFRYPDVPATQIAGDFLHGSGLRNSGERLTLQSANGTIVANFVYGDSEPWPPAADGAGPSLVLMRPATNPDSGEPLNWRPSAVSGGNPAEGDALLFVGDPNRDDDGDGLTAYAEHALGTSDTDSSSREGLRVEVQQFEVEGQIADFLTVTFPQDLRAEDVEVVPQVSADLIEWESEAVVPVFVSQAPGAGTRVVVSYRLSIPVPDCPRLFARLLVQGRPH